MVLKDKEGDHLSVWVVGGGLAGLASAAALQRHCSSPGGSITVLERCSAAEFHDQTAGASAMLGPNGLRALEQIGGPELVARVLEEGHTVTNIGIVLPQKNQTVMLIPDTSERDTGLPQVIVRWGILRKLLQDLLPEDCVQTGTGADICGYTCTDDGSVFPADAQGRLVGPALSASSSAPSFLVVADGINSPFQSLIRMGDQLLTGPDAKSIRKSNVQDNGRVNVKAVVQMELDYDAYDFKDFAGQSLPKGTALAFNAPDGSASCFAGSAGKGYVYWAISVADRVDDRGSVVKFFSKCNADTASPMKQKLLDILIALQAKECQFAIDLIAATAPDKIFAERSQQLTLVGPSFATQDHKVVLVGDAAHAMSPAYGQGSNFAFEDSATLALCLAREENDIATALQAYSDLRVDRCEEMFRRSAERATKQAKGESTEDVQKWISNWDPPTFLG